MPHSSDTRKFYKFLQFHCHEAFVPFIVFDPKIIIAAINPKMVHAQNGSPCKVRHAHVLRDIIVNHSELNILRTLSKGCNEDYAVVGAWICRETTEACLATRLLKFLFQRTQPRLKACALEQLVQIMHTRLQQADAWR